MECMRYLDDGFVKGLVLDGRFETISNLNHGSFGMVFLAKDLATSDMVAIKCLTKASAAKGCPAVNVDDKSIEMFCHDRLGDHPNIVNLLHSFETDAHIYLVLELCSNGDLYEAIKRGCGPLQTENVRDFMLELVNAVDYMHAKGIYHRDIKPENIFLTQNGSMKLGDFGLACTDAWSHEASVGSDRYMAPEQYDPAEKGYSPAKADVWAIGICLLNILFARNPFDTPTTRDKLFLDFSRDNQALFDIFPTMSQDTFSVLIHCLATDPRKRSLTGIRESLEKVLSFTTDDEDLDEFCVANEGVPPTANREPLRTPSIQSPQVDNGGAFPWAKALQASPQRPTRQLSIIPDTESYSEDLFSSSERDRTSWYTAGQNSSLASGLDSMLGASVKSMALNVPPPRKLQQAESKSTSESFATGTTTPIPTMSRLLGKKDEGVSKSWTDIFDEDEEAAKEEELIRNRREQNSRTWSNDSKDEDEDKTIRGGLSDITDSPVVNTRTQSPQISCLDVLSEEVSEHEQASEEQSKPQLKTQARYSPPSKRTIMDRWAALGNRRRGYNQGLDPLSKDEKRTATSNWRVDLRNGLGFSVFSSTSANRDRKGNSVEKGPKKESKTILDWRRGTNTSQQSVDSLGFHLEDV